VHDLILHFPKGYDTVLGDGGAGLSGGQKQRIGLARAMYDNPAVLVLDEPNSNLDDVGEAALVQAVQDFRQRGKTVILITHRTSIIGATNKLLVLRDGTVALFGPTQQVLQALQEQNQKALQAAQAQRAAQQQAAQQQAAQQAAQQQGTQQQTAAAQQAASREADEIAAQQAMLAERNAAAQAAKEQE
jgi:ATP-binding cassette subfamily C exporter for protease/lipase